MRRLQFLQIRRDSYDRGVRIGILGLSYHAGHVGSVDLWKSVFKEDDVKLDLAHRISHCFRSVSHGNGAAA